MKRAILPLIVGAALVLGPLPAQDAWSAPQTQTINCDAGGVTAGATFDGMAATETITFTVTGAGACSISLPAGVGTITGVTGSAPNFTTNSSTVVITVVGTGAFTVTSAGASDTAQSFWVDTCSLTGVGLESSPWQVGTLSNFQTIGDGGCLGSGHYKQTAPITLTNVSDRVPSFSGVYDGDFYTITLGGSGAGSWTGHTSSEGVFGLNLAGTVKKLYLAGDYVTSSWRGSPLVTSVRRGGLVSQVHSSVNVTVTGNLDTVYISGLVRTLGRGAIMEYSSASGTLTWLPASVGGVEHYYGGLVADAGNDLDSIGRDNPRGTEIRDSYSTVTVSWPVAGKCRAYFGGVVGYVPTVAGDVYVVRSYSASSISSASVAGAACSGSIQTSVGGLIGRSDISRNLASVLPAAPSYTYLVSSFWAKDLIGGASTSIGFQQGSASNQTASNQYVGGLPRGVGLDSSLLKDIRTFESREGATAGLPSNSSDLPIASSLGTKSTDGTLTTNAATHRWGIEPGNQVAFIPADYSDSQDFLTRTLLTDITVSRSMAGRQNPNLEGPVTNYPHLGRIWEICSGENNGFPVLVWEGRTCGGAAGAAYAGVPSADPLPSGEGSGGSGDAGSGGSSGVTGAQQPALAATGPNDSQSLFLLASSGILLLLGGVAFWVRQRIRKINPINPS